MALAHPADDELAANAHLRRVARPDGAGTAEVHHGDVDPDDILWVGYRKQHGREPLGRERPDPDLSVAGGIGREASRIHTTLARDGATRSSNRSASR